VLQREEVLDAAAKRDEALATLKGIMLSEKGRQVLLHETDTVLHCHVALEQATT